MTDTNVSPKSNVFTLVVQVIAPLTPEIQTLSDKQDSNDESSLSNTKQVKKNNSSKNERPIIYETAQIKLKPVSRTGKLTLSIISSSTLISQQIARQLTLEDFRITLF